MKISKTTLIIIVFSIIAIIIFFCNYDKDTPKPHESFGSQINENKNLEREFGRKIISDPNLIVIPTSHPDCITKCNEINEFCLNNFPSNRESGFREKTELNKCKTSYELCAVNCSMDIPNLDGQVEYFSEEDKILKDRDEYCESITDPYWRYYCFGARHL